ncbi:High mobility group box 1 [Rhizopus azygosporus]|uniref:High mobility group box 1 n=1 Tax=Rhizopus azygosporus TaxID=86630 RepID=A0A367KEC0_RHIAZ|nr:High mobility group box 1 [Rhizopus azygosporus]
MAEQDFFDAGINTSFTFQYSIANMTTIPTTTGNNFQVQRKFDPSIHRSYYLPPINNGYALQQRDFDQQQWKNNNVSQTPQHIVSPEAIREAQKEESEEPDRPFSKFTSFLALKQRRVSPEPKYISSPSSIKVNSDEIRIEEELIPYSSEEDDIKKLPNLFNNDLRSKLLETSSRMTVAEISKDVVDGWWKTIPDDERQYYIKQATMFKEGQKYPDLAYSRKSKPEKRQLVDPILSQERSQQTTPVISGPSKKRSRKSNLPEGQKDPRGRKKKRHRHPFAPKHPMSAYLYYLADVYPKVSQNFPGSTVGPISKSISATWHAMTAEERLPWKQKAESDKARYAREMEVYMAKNKLQEQQQQQQASLNHSIVQ